MERLLWVAVSTDRRKFLGVRYVSGPSSWLVTGRLLSDINPGILDTSNRFDLRTTLVIICAFCAEIILQGF